MSPEDSSDNEQYIVNQSSEISLGESEGWHQKFSLPCLHLKVKIILSTLLGSSYR